MEPFGIKQHLRFLAGVLFLPEKETLRAVFFVPLFRAPAKAPSEKGSEGHYTGVLATVGVDDHRPGLRVKSLDPAQYHPV